LRDKHNTLARWREFRDRASGWKRVTFQALWTTPRRVVHRLALPRLHHRLPGRAGPSRETPP
jgi:hypothetical protein